MNVIGLFSFLSILVGLTLVSEVAAGRWGDKCTYNVQCNRQFSCRNERCTHPCEESFDQNAICVFFRNTWLSRCNNGYVFNYRTQKCERKLLPNFSRNGEDCKKDEHCKKPYLCENETCIHPCEFYPTKNSFCFLDASKQDYEDDVWLSECLPGYALNDADECVSEYAPGADPSRHYCTSSKECKKPLGCSLEHKCVHPCELLISENAICIVQYGAFTSECRSDYYFGGNPTKCLPRCANDTECPHDKACKNGKCVNPCMWPMRSFVNCTVENHQPKYTCSPGYVRPPGFRQCVLEASLR